MKQDYLWDASGPDAEIERLETLLSPYKFKSSDPPRLPVAAVSPWWRFWDARFAVPAFATVLLMAVASAALLYLIGTQDRVDVAAVPTRAISLPVAETVEQPLTPPAARAGLTSVSAASMRRSGPTAVGAVGTKRAVAEPTLTKEERYAYNQLMLALSITGSSLRAVQDTIDESEPAAVKPGKIEKLDK